METNFWLTPVHSWEDKTPEDVIQTLVKGERIYALGEKTHGRKLLKPGDWICFYIPGKGIVAHASCKRSQGVKFISPCFLKGRDLPHFSSKNRKH